MPIDLVALDLDGTLLDPQGGVSPRNRRAVRAALERGVRIVLVTGRGIDMPIALSKELGLNLPVICAHGALTKDFGANRTLGHIPVPLVYAKPMLEYAQQHRLSIAVYTDERFHFLEGSTILMPEMAGSSWREVRNFAEVLSEAPTFIRFLGRESVAALEREFFDLPLHYKYESWGDFLECAVTSREATKQRALARLCADFQVPRERVLAVGDSPNDVPMLRWAGTGVAMGNAASEVREAVAYVTAGNAEDGVATAIERFVLQQRRGSEKKLA